MHNTYHLHKRIDRNWNSLRTTNGDVFLQFVNERLVPNLLPFDGVNPRSVVIMGMIFSSAFKVVSAI